MHFPYVLLFVFVTTFSVSGTLFPAAATPSSAKLTAQEKPLNTFESLNQAQNDRGKFLRALKELKTNDEERSRFDFLWLKKLVPGSSSWKAAQTAKASKLMAKQLKNEKKWLMNSQLYDEIVKNDEELFATFKVWKGFGYSEDAGFEGMKTASRDSGNYMDIFHRYKLFLREVK